MKKIFLAGWIFLIIMNSLSMGYAQNQNDASQKNTRKLDEVTVIAPKHSHTSFLPDVQGTRIYSGKKTSLVDLKELPTIANNNYRQALIKQAGLLLSEETTPLFSLGYRGLNPDRAQFMQVMKDGIPIQADMFGYPEAYYTPLLQTVDRIEFIRGGSALMYGPQPGGALNYVTKKPVTSKKFLTYSENVFGTDDYFSTYEAVTGTLGPIGYLGYFHERQGDGFRRSNSDFEVISSGIKMMVNQTGSSRLTLNYEEYHEEHGEPGGLSLTTASAINYNDNREAVTREFDRFRLERYHGSLIYEKEFSETTQFDFKVYGGHYRRWSRRQRGGGFGTLPSGSASTTNDIQEQDFYNLGFEPHLRHDYELFGETHTLTVGTHTYFSKSPRTDQRGITATADSGSIRNENNRYMRYFSLFMENLFHWEKLSVTPGVRLEHFWQRIEEKVNVNRDALVDRQTFDFVPLFGLGIAYEIMRGVEAYANITQSHRPQLFAESVPTGASQVVSQDLQEGFAWQYDFGLRGKPVSFVSWDVNYFLVDFKDQIGTVGNSVENVGDARHHGMEFSTEIDLIGAYDFYHKKDLSKKAGSFAPFVTLALLDAEFNEGPNKGRQPAYAPQYNLRLGINYNWRDRVKLSLLSTFLGDHFADDASTLNRKIPSYKVWDLTGEVNLFKNAFHAFGLSLFGGINNLFDEKYYARITGTGIDPAYGRNIYGGVKIDLG